MTGPSTRCRFRSRFTVDPWDPGYGLAFGEELDGGALEESSAELDLDLETAAGAVAARRPRSRRSRCPARCCSSTACAASTPGSGCTGPAPQPVPGIAASFAAGLVCLRRRRPDCRRHRRTRPVHRGRRGDRHRRPARRATRPGSPHGPAYDQLSLALQQRLARPRYSWPSTYRTQHPAADDLLVVDGPLRGRTHLDRAVGYIKTHHASYLPPEQAAVVAALRPGQRTPAFTMGTSWRRTSWYLQLPRTAGVPWSGVVRLECSADLPLAEVTRLADLTARVLPPLASVPHKDPRAPQNLVPIGGLERELRHRLGDQQILYRALRAATMPVR